MYKKWGKRLLDILISGILLILLSPVFVGVALWVRLCLGSPILFRQDRPGRGAALFRVIKFRSMKDASDSEGKPLPDEERLGRFGRFLRATSLDELPELWNVLRGQMSLVGPRPLLPQYVSRYSPEQARRMEVLPGITGWAQIKGRNALEWEERFRLDVWYVDNLSLMLDLKIIFLTLWQVLTRKGIASEGCATTHEFMGSDDRD